MKRRCIKLVGALGLAILVAACASTYHLPMTTKSGSISQQNFAKMGGPAALNGILLNQHGLPIYSSFSIYRGAKPWKGKPKTEIARHASDNVKISIMADGASPEQVAVARKFAADFADAFSAIDARIWKNDDKRRYDITLLMFPPGTKLNRKTTRVFFGKTFHTQFYFPLFASDKTRNVGQMYGDATVTAHEMYHLRQSRLGGVRAKPYRSDLTRTQRHILEEAGGQFIGACVGLKVKKVIGIGSQVVFSKRDPATGNVRVGTLSDNMIRAALKPGAAIAPADFEALGPMLFATYWAEHTGPKFLIHAQDDAAKQIQQVCDTYITDPTWLWPVFWQIARDGEDAPDFSHSP